MTLQGFGAHIIIYTAINFSHISIVNDSWCTTDLDMHIVISSVKTFLNVYREQVAPNYGSQEWAFTFHIHVAFMYQMIGHLNYDSHFVSCVVWGLYVWHLHIIIPMGYKNIYMCLKCSIGSCMHHLIWLRLMRDRCCDGVYRHSGIYFLSH